MTLAPLNLQMFDSVTPPWDGWDEVVGEREMLPRLVAMLSQRRVIRDGSVLVEELAWRGRRVDLTTLTKSGVLSAYELKVSDFGRAIEQAIYNSHVFDRSWVVAQRPPSDAMLVLARSAGIGIIQIPIDSRPKVFVRAMLSVQHPRLREQLTRQICVRLEKS